MLVLLLSGQWISAPVNAAVVVNPAAPTPEAVATAATGVAMKPAGAQNALANADNQAVTYLDPSGRLGWFVDQYKGLRLLDHEGNTAGFTADLAFLPQADLGITMLTNVQGANFFTEAVRYRLFELVFGQPEEYDAQANYSYKTLRQGLLPPGFTLGKVDARQVQNDLGFYHNAALGDINIELVGNRLLMDVGEAVLQLRPRLNQKGQLDKYVIYDPPMLGIPVEFKRDVQGNLTVVLGEGVTEYVFTPED